VLSVALYTARIPMARTFRHAGKARGASASVLLALRADAASGRWTGEETGWGEAAPREYVTGESIPSVLAALGDRPLPAEAVDLASAPPAEALTGLAALPLPRLLGTPPGPAQPAAAAALETALFDLVCRRHDVAGFRALHLAGFGDLLSATPSAMPVATVLDLDRDPIAHLTGLSAIQRAAIPHVKLKAGPSVGLVAALVKRVRALVPDATVSVDANGGWAAQDVLVHARDLVRAGVAWLEEPLAPRRWADLARVRRAGLRVMLDESFSCAQDLADAVTHEAADLVNLRVSKCGGPLRLLTLAQAARAAGLGCQLGVQVGEVGPLWAAGRLIGTALATPTPVAVEAGRQDEWFPPELTRPGYQVDRDTSRAPALTGPGIGLRPTTALLAQCTPHLGSMPRATGASVLRKAGRQSR
jgi:L-alanine-DL-glutamate epimerase-like enolase superfamily enzyme